MQDFKLWIRYFPTWNNFLKGTNFITPCTCPYSYRGVCSSNTWISFEHTHSPIWWNHESFFLYSPTYWSWFPPFCWCFSSWDESYFRLGNICLCFGLFTTSFFRWRFGYDVWTSTRLFCPRWLCECFRLLLQGM